MTHQAFDPAAVEAEMIKAGLLPVRRDPEPSRLGQLEHYFTERDPRLYSLWRISMVRQFQPAVLRQLPDQDLLYLAGQSPEGYVGKEYYGIQLDKNKIAQNALRARVELDTRTAQGAWRRTLILAFASLVVGALLPPLAMWIGALTR